MKITIPYRLALTLKILLSLATVDLFGQNMDPGTSSGPSTGGTVESKDYKGVSLKTSDLSIREDVNLSYAYVGDAHLKSGATGRMSEQTSRFGYGLRVPLNESLTLQWGIDYNRLDFGQPAGSPLPYDLQTISTNLGAQYKLSDRWSVFGAVMPRLEMIDNWDRIESQDFQLSGAVGASYDPNANLSFRFGLVVNPGGLGTPVLPIIGVRWQFAQPWTLDFGFPRTAVDYQLLPNLRLSLVEVGFEGGSFHTSKDYGSTLGMSKLNDRKLEYTEVRVGSGADYAIMKNIHVDLTAGAVVYRKFDFQDASYSPKVKPAPYVQLGVHIGF